MFFTLAHLATPLCVTPTSYIATNYFYAGASTVMVLECRDGRYGGITPELDNGRCYWACSVAFYFEGLVSTLH